MGDFANVWQAADKVVYSTTLAAVSTANTRLERHFDWAAPDDDVFAFITDLMRSAGTYLYGRRMYDTMAVWETDAALAAQSDLMGPCGRKSPDRSRQRGGVHDGMRQRHRRVPDRRFNVALSGVEAPWLLRSASTTDRPLGARSARRGNRTDQHGEVVPTAG